MQFKITFTNDDLDLTQALQSLIDQGYSPQGAVKQIMRRGLCPKTEQPTIIINVSEPSTGAVEGPSSDREGVIDDADKAIFDAFDNAFGE